MEYSLLSRFQGCLWGMVLGEQFGLTRAALRNEIASGRLQPLETVSLIQSHNSGMKPVSQPLSQTAGQVLRAILQVGTWNASVAQGLQRTSWPTLSSATLSIAALPITLLFHDDLNLQRQALWQLFDTVQANETSGYAAMVYAYAIAQAIKGQLNPRLLIDQTQAYLRVTVPDSTQALPELLNQLDQIQYLQATEADLLTAMETLQGQSLVTNSSIAIALYCFLQTPHALQLSLRQAAHVNTDSSSICALTAALSGAYNSFAGIPAAWSTTAPDVRLDQLQQQTAHLLALWSGIYDAAAITDAAAIAVVAPWVFR